jgi:protease-4
VKLALRTLTTAALLGALASAAMAEAPPFADGPLGNESVAVTDDAAGFLFNPAAGGWRHRNELQFTYGEIEDTTGVKHRLLRGILQYHGLAFSASQVEDDQQELLLGARTGGPFSLGIAAHWLISERTGDHATDWTLGVLARPNPWFSLGGTLEHPSQPRFDGERMARVYTGGLALRPIAMFSRARAYDLGPRLTISLDVRVREGEGSSDDGSLARLGVEAEVLRGITLRGAWEERAVRFGISLATPRATWHARADEKRNWDPPDQFPPDFPVPDAPQPLTRSLTLALHSNEERTILTSKADRRVAVMRASGRLSDESLSGFTLLGSDVTRSSLALHQALERALGDPLTRGVLLELGGVRGMAQIEELRPRIARLRAAGKPVVAFLETGGGRGDLYLASACDRIVTTEEADFMALGLRVENRSYRRALADLGIRIDRASIGEYKSAYREFSVDSVPPADREEIEHQLDVVQERFVSTVARDRRIPRENLERLLDGRRWPAQDMVRAGVLDTIGDRRTALAVLGNLAKMGARPRTVALSTRPEARRAWAVPTWIAIVHASGGIETGSSGSDLLNGPSLGARTLIAQLESAFGDRRVKAVVFRIESPGGSVVGSSLIRTALTRLKTETKKPLIVSMGTVAASGGYDIAIPGDVLFADPTTISGSIGVLFVKPSLEGFYARHKVRQQDFQRGDAMRGFSWARDWDPELQAAADSSVAGIYQTFVSRVAKARGRSFAAIDSVARGRVWFGDEAVTHGLVDRVGGLEDAIAEARRRAGVPDGQKIQPVVYLRPRAPWFERLLTERMAIAWQQAVGTGEWEPMQARADLWLDP